MKTAAILLIVFAGALSAWALPVYFQFSYNIGSGSVTGVLDAVDQGNGSYLVTGATGNYAGVPITGVFDPSLSGNVFAFDELLFLPGKPYVDIGGIVFELNGDANISTGINLYWDGAGYRSIDGGNNGPYVDPLIIPVDLEQPVPEPGTLGMLAPGALGIAAILRRRLHLV